jgi:hypothetical protein
VPAQVLCLPAWILDQRPFSNRPFPVGSRAGARTVGSGGKSTAFAVGLSPAPLATSPAPATSNGAGGFPALRSPARFTPRLMRLTAAAALWAVTPSHGLTPPGPLGPAFPPAYIPRLRSCRSMGASIMAPLPPVSPEESRAAGPLGSAGVTPLPRYYGPIRHPLAVGRLPGIAGYTAYPASAAFAAGRGGLLQLLAGPLSPCCR